MEIILRDIELKLLAELMRNCRRSDRELAKILHISQPTASRIRIKLEKEDMINYCGQPNLAKLGYEIIAVTLGKRNYEKHPENLIEKAREFVEKHPNLIFTSDGMGLGFDLIGISVHKNFTEYEKFRNELAMEAGEAATSDSFLVSLNSKGIVQYLSFKRFGEQLVREKS